MSDVVLVLNAGSSSIKFGLFDITPTEPALRCKGQLDEHEKAPRIVVTDASGKEVFEKHPAREDDSNDLLTDIFAWIENHLAGVGLAAVGHRIVHGGSEFSDAVVITDQTLAALEALIPLAPLHQPRCLASVRRVRTLRPELTQIACFDTAFHHGLMLPASRFAIPRLLEERGIRRYGFHGLSPSNTLRVGLPRSRRNGHKNARWWRISAMARVSARCIKARASTPLWG